FARGDAVSRGRDPFGLVRIEQPELRVYPGCGRFDPAQPAGDGRRDRLTRHLKVLYCLARLASPELLLRFYLGHAVESRKKREPRRGRPSSGAIEAPAQPPGWRTPFALSVYRAYWLIDSVGSSYMTSAATTSIFGSALITAEI